MVIEATELDTAVSDFIDQLLKGIRVEAVVLYGSYAHGTAHKDSDIDLAVISPNFEEVPMWRRQEMIADLSVHRYRDLSPIGYPSSEYRNPGPHSFLREIIRTGRVVYEAPRE